MVRCILGPGFDTRGLCSGQIMVKYEINITNQMVLNKNIIFSIKKLDCTV